MTKRLQNLDKKTLKNFQSTWDIAKFSKGHRPIILGMLDDKKALDTPAVAHSGERAFFSKDGLYIEDMPIRFPGSDYRVPTDIQSHFSDVLQQLFAYEKMLGCDMNKSYIYLTIHQSFVGKGKQQRRGGVHIDGFQNPEIKPQRIQHQIAVSNRLPTVFYDVAMDVSKLNVPKHAFFNEVARQCKGAKPITPASYQIHLLNAYCPHETNTAEEDGFRTFIRLTSSVFPFMGRDNTRNPLFDYDWSPEAKKKFYQTLKR